jgi:hypothetical protein
VTKFVTKFSSRGRNARRTLVVQKARSFLCRWLCRHQGRNGQQFLPLDWAFDAATIATGLGLVCPPDPAPCPSDAALWERLCFAAQTKNLWMTSAAVIRGIAIPALVYALMRASAALYSDCHSKA